jgi:hypothetical protein
LFFRQRTFELNRIDEQWNLVVYSSIDLALLLLLLLLLVLNKYSQVDRRMFYLDPAPRDVRVVRINDTSIQVLWSPIFHPPTARYIVHYNDKAENRPENQWALFSPSNPAAVSAIISGLKPDAMYNVRVSAEFASANINDPSYSSGTTRREGDLSEIHVADIYRRKFKRNLLASLKFA